MVHHNNGVADARRRRFCARLSIIAGSRSREGPSERATLCKTLQLGWDGPFQNWGRSCVNLFHNPRVWGRSGAPSTRRRPRRTGKAVDREYNNGVMVHHNNGVADARDRRFCARPSIIAGSCGREEPSERVILCKTLQLGWDGPF